MSRPTTLILGAALALFAGCRAPQSAYPVREPKPGLHPMFQRAEQAYLRGNLDEALRLFRAYRRGYAPNGAAAEPRYWEGVILLQQEKIPDAEAALGQAVEESRSRLLTALSFTALGDCSFHEKDYETALAHYQRAVDLRVAEARNDYALYRLGTVRQRLGDWGGAHTYYQMLLRDYPYSVFRPQVERQLHFPARAYYVEAGAFEGRREAVALVHKLHGAAFTAELIEPQADKRFRVWVGGYRCYRDAENALAKVAIAAGRAAQIVP